MAAVDGPHPELRLLSPGNASTAGVCVSVRFGAWTDYFFRTSDEGHIEHEFADYRTDATLAFVRQPADATVPATGFCEQGTIHDKNGRQIRPM